MRAHFPTHWQDHIPHRTQGNMAGRFSFQVLLLSLGLAFLISSHTPESRAQSTRPFNLGFTDYPYDVTTQASQDWTWSTIKSHGDIVTFHEEDAVPWTEALAARYDLYHPNYQAYIYQRALQRAALPATHKVFLYLNVMNGQRNGIAGYRGAEANQPLPAPFNQLTQKFADPRVIEAFVNHAEFMIAVLKPDYFAYGIESNMLISQIIEGKVPFQAWQDFIAGTYMIYYRIKTLHPTLPIFFTIQADDFNKNRAVQTELLKWTMPANDLIAISSYPFGHGLTPATLPMDYFTALRVLDPKKKIAFAETGWPAEPVFYPDPLPAGATPWYNIAGSPADQDAYLNRVLETLQNNNGEFLNWFVVRDYDDTYTKVMQFLSFAWLGRMWRDIGLFDGRGSPRTAFWRWYITKMKAKTTVNLPFGINSPGGWEDSPFLSLDGQRLYFMYNPYNFSSIFTVPNGHPIVQGRPRAGQTILANPWENSMTYMATKKADGTWSEPTNIGIGPSACGMESPDGKNFVFIHGAGASGADVWISTKQPDGKWGLPSVLPSQVNSAQHEDNPHLTGNLLCFSSYRTGGMGGKDLYCSLRATSTNGSQIWLGPINLGKEINTTSDEDQVWVSPDQRRLYFTRYEPSGARIYVATRTTTSGFYWTSPQPLDLGTVSAAEPSFTQDEKFMTFATYDSVKRDVVIMQSTKDANGKWSGIRPVD